MCPRIQTTHAKCIFFNIQTIIIRVSQNANHTFKMFFLVSIFRQYSVSQNTNHTFILYFNFQCPDNNMQGVPENQLHIQNGILIFNIQIIIYVGCPRIPFACIFRMVFFIFRKYYIKFIKTESLL